MRLILAILLVFSSSCTAEQGTQDNPKTGYLYGTVVKVIDGDTITILNAEMRQAKIRLAEIDTPERAQPFWKWAKEQLAGMVAGEAVAIHISRLLICSTTNQEDTCAPTSSTIWFLKRMDMSQKCFFTMREHS